MRYTAYAATNAAPSIREIFRPEMNTGTHSRVTAAMSGMSMPDQAVVHSHWAHQRRAEDERDVVDA